MRFTARLKQHDLCKICEHLHTWPLKKEGSGQLGFQTDWSAASQLGDCMTWLPTCMSMYEHVVALVFCWLLCWLFSRAYVKTANKVANVASLLKSAYYRTLCAWHYGSRTVPATSFAQANASHSRSQVRRQMINHVSNIADTHAHMQTYTDASTLT